MKSLQTPSIVHVGCGNTFERWALEKWLSNNETCPITRQSANYVPSLVPNLMIKNKIAELREEPQIPIFSDGDEENENETLAKEHLKMAQLSIDQGKYDDALTSYETEAIAK